MAAGAWTPEKSELGIGTVVVKSRPDKELTLDHYRGMLSSRIDRMVAGLSPQELRAEAALAMVVEGLDLTEAGSPGALMAEMSDALLARSGMGAQTWPIPASELRLDKPLGREMMDADLSLAEFLDLIYNG
jgi:hypothetical protein